MRRRLTIRTKLAATLAVPLAALASFAALQVRDAYNRSEQVRLQAGLATRRRAPAGVLNALENERDYAGVARDRCAEPRRARTTRNILRAGHRDHRRRALGELPTRCSIRSAARGGQLPRRR